MPSDKPNILLIMADDIGWFDVGAYHRGIMGTTTPNIDRIAAAGRDDDRQLRAGQLHGRPGGVHHRADSAAHRPDHRGPAGRRAGHPAQRPDAGGADQAGGLPHRADRQEPPGRPQQVPAHRARVRRVLRQPLPPQRRGGARAAGVPQGAADLPADVHAARRAGLQGHRRRRPDRRPPLRSDRQADHPRFRPADPQADGDHRGGPARALAGLHRPRRRRGRAVPVVAQHHPDARLDPPVGEVEGQDRAGRVRRRHAGARLGGRRTAGQARRAGHRRQHPGGLRQRQRLGGLHLAGRRDLAVPRREGPRLGGRIPLAAGDSLARQDPGRAGAERHLLAGGHPADRDGRRRGSGYQGETAGRPRRRRQALPGAHRRLQPAAVPHRGGRRSRRGTSSSTTANATCSRCGTTTGRCISRPRTTGSPGRC